ncbi:MAG: hypothetical protein JWO94_979 [Verrucomicrobiaceae bacterium]|nr:hypothetical protein [Verrucomicrobiaceae bacterium]
MVHLDTNFLIDALVAGSAQESALTAWLAHGEPVSISTVAWGEFLCGPLSPTAETAARQMLPSTENLTRTDAEMAANLFNKTGRRSKSYADCCIAAVAIRAQARLATSNLSDFAPMAPLGLALRKQSPSSGLAPK